jgi:hypothetical protein
MLIAHLAVAENVTLREGKNKEKAWQDATEAGLPLRYVRSHHHASDL